MIRIIIIMVQEDVLTILHIMLKANVEEVLHMTLRILHTMMRGDER